MRKRVETLEDMFSKFQDQYIKNGKELTRLADAVKYLHEAIKENKENDKQFRADLKPVMDSYNTIINGRKIILYMALLISAIGTSVIAIKKLFS